MPNITINGSILLPPDMQWKDEFTWVRSSVSNAIGLTGKLLQQRRVLRNGGRPITLVSAPDAALLNRAQLTALHALCETGAAFTLVFADGRSYTVRFDDTDNKPIEAEPIQPGKVPHTKDLYVTTLRFMEMPV